MTVAPADDAKRDRAMESPMIFRYISILLAGLLGAAKT
jgi:hypothetical protein